MLLVVSITWPLVIVTLCPQNEKWNWCTWYALWIYSTLVFLSDSNPLFLNSSLPIWATPVWSIQNKFVALSCMLVLKEYYRAFALQCISVYLLPEISDYLSTSTAFVQTFVFERMPLMQRALLFCLFPLTSVWSLLQVCTGWCVCLCGDVTTCFFCCVPKAN